MSDDTTAEITTTIETAAQIIFRQRTGSPASQWFEAPTSTRGRYIEEARALDQSGLLIRVDANR